MVEDGSFAPMVMSSTGGMGEKTTQVIKHLAHKIAEKRNEPYSKVVGLLRVRFSFAMMRSALVCLRGSRTVRKRDFDLMEYIDTPVDLAVEELRLRL